MTPAMQAPKRLIVIIVSVSHSMHLSAFFRSDMTMLSFCSTHADTFVVAVVFIKAPLFL
jgi:hypothetical protein